MPHAVSRAQLYPRKQFSKRLSSVNVTAVYTGGEEGINHNTSKERATQHIKLSLQTHLYLQRPEKKSMNQSYSFEINPLTSNTSFAVERVPPSPPATMAFVSLKKEKQL